MAQKQQAKPQNNQKNTTKTKSSYSAVLERMNNLMSAYSNLPMDSIYSAFGRAMGYWANMPQIQNSRVKAISPLPADISKEELGEFLRSPQNSELPLQQVSEGLKWTSYPYYKITKSYADMLTYKNYVIPQYIDGETANKESFKREFRLADKIRKACSIPEIGHKVTGQAVTQGKVFYTMRYSVDRSHNKVNYVFYQELPKAWCTIIGHNNISNYTVSFNLMYFLQPGTDYRQFGDLFEPYLEDFNAIFEEPKDPKNKKFIYATKNDSVCTYKVNGKEFTLHPNNVNSTGTGNPKMFMQNGRWFYYVSLPIDRVWTFEIDDTTAVVASPLSGLMQTFAQQADYEAAQLSLVLNPLIKILTGEIPYYTSTQAKEDDGYRLSIGGRALFEAYFNQLMAQTNTAGVGFYTAPVSNIKSHDFAESANANDVSNSFLTYGANKTGLNALIPITDNPHQGVAEYSAKLESKYTQCIYRTLAKMTNYLLESLNLQYEWKCVVFGDIYSDDTTRANALKELDKGDISAYFILAALNDQSVLDKVTMCDVIDSIDLLGKLQVPQTAYTQSSSTTAKSDTGGRPSEDEAQKMQKDIEKATKDTDNA